MVGSYLSWSTQSVPCWLLDWHLSKIRNVQSISSHVSISRRSTHAHNYCFWDLSRLRCRLENNKWNKYINMYVYRGNVWEKEEQEEWCYSNNSQSKIWIDVDEIKCGRFLNYFLQWVLIISMYQWIWLEGCFRTINLILMILEMLGIQSNIPPCFLGLGMWDLMRDSSKLQSKLGRYSNFCVFLLTDDDYVHPTLIRKVWIPDLIDCMLHLLKLV